MKRVNQIVIFSLMILLSVKLLSAQQLREIASFELDPVQLLKTRSDADIKNARVTIAAGKRPIGAILHGIVYQTGVQFGLEFDNADSGRNHIFKPYLYVIDGSKPGQILVSERSPDDYSFAKSLEFSAQNVRLEDFLEDLVPKLGDSSWEINDGVVNIRPKRRRDPAVEKFLNTKISKFWFPAGQRTGKFFDTVRDLPEFVERRIKIETLGLPTTGNGQNFTLSEAISLTDVTVRELLNRLAKLNQCGWFVAPSDTTERSKDGELIVHLGI